MGADGYVKIFKLKPLQDNYPNDYAEFLRFIRDNKTYTHNILGVDVVTSYSGDNLYGYTRLEILFMGIRERNPLIFESYVDSYEAQEIKSLSEEKLSLYIEMAHFIFNTKYDDIEVWT